MPSFWSVHIISVMCHQHLLICHQCCDVRHHWMFDHKICHKKGVSSPVTRHHSLCWERYDQASRARTWNAVTYFCKGGREHRKQSNPSPSFSEDSHKAPKNQFNSNLCLEKQDQAIEFLIWSSFVFSAFFSADSKTLDESQSKILKYFGFTTIGGHPKTWGVLKIIGVSCRKLVFWTAHMFLRFFNQFSSTEAPLTHISPVIATLVSWISSVIC